MIDADVLVRRLRQHGVAQVFGYPGGQMTPLYDALARDGQIRHVLARDEQAAGFMADGFARATGRPGVCLAVCGPGVNNAVTPLATAFTDSVPFLLISGQVPRAGRGLRSGYYHENDQLRVCETCTKMTIRVDDIRDVTPLLDRAFHAMSEGRPGPVLFEVPLDVLRGETTLDDSPVPSSPVPRDPAPGEVETLARLVRGWRRPILLAGGGVITAEAGPQLKELAERLGAPVFHTAMGMGAFPANNELWAGTPWYRATSDLRDMQSNFSPLFAEADGLLAIGCRFTQLATGTWTLKLPSEVAQIDVDPAELGRHYPLTIGVCADARRTLDALLASLPSAHRSPWTVPKRPAEPWLLSGMDLVTPLRRALPPETIIVADITRLAYLMMPQFPVYRPRTFLHAAGYVSMGHGIPAALGARTAFPDRPIVAIAGDGCFLMSGMELASSVQEKLPIVVVLINDAALSLIKAIQHRKYENRFLGVDLLNPDFALFARAFGVGYQSATTPEEFEVALRHSLGQPGTTLLEVRVP